MRNKFEAKAKKRFNLYEAYLNTDHKTPIICAMLDDDVNPSNDIRNLALEMGYAEDTVKCVSLHDAKVNMGQKIAASVSLRASKTIVSKNLPSYVAFT